jgi:hypothetical protein
LHFIPHDVVRRLMLAMCTVSLLGEVGVITVTLLELLSGSHPDEATSKQQYKLGAVLASLGTTFLTFCLTVIGAGSIVTGFKTVMKNISRDGSSP